MLRSLIRWLFRRRPRPVPPTPDGPATIYSHRAGAYGPQRPAGGDQ